MARKISLLIILYLALFIQTGYAQSEMIANIEQDIVTEFGVYHPYVVTITPNAESYTVKPDLSNVRNHDAFSFSEKEKQLLTSNYFVVIPTKDRSRTTYNEIFDLYNECRELGIPIFVTTDALLHTFHLCFDFILQTIEQKKMIGDLSSLLRQLINETEQQQWSASDTSIQEALGRNNNFLYVALHLLDNTYIPVAPQQAYYEELALIESASVWERSPLFGYEEDYTQYIPRGHYTKTDSLRHYFLSMMWLGRMTFAADRNQPVLSQKMTRSAILLLQAMNRSFVGNETGMAVWERIYNPTVFFVGKSDDINFYQYLEIADRVYGANFKNLSADHFANNTLLDQFLEVSYSLPGPRITYPEQPKGFRFMGQRFTPDSWILDELVFSKVRCLRVMPKGLDVMAVLGSKRADELLTAIGEKARYPEYATKLDSLKQTVKTYPEEVWVQNLYWNWLYSLMPLLYPKGAGFPPFMQKLAWTDKELFASLGSWSELRHDTILYVKQSGTERGGKPLSNLIQGFVEPNPHLWGRLASLSEYLIAGLNYHGLLFPAFDAHLNDLKNLLLSLKVIAEKELINQSLSIEEYDLICNIGKRIETIVEFSEYESEGPNPLAEMKMPLIADVHTDANSNTCLEEAVGYPFEIYVICLIEGELVITRGAGFSHYEFTWPITDRLADEKWQQMLIHGNNPELAPWTGSFLNLSEASSSLNPGSYFWQKRGLQKIFLIVTPDTIEVGRQVQIEIGSEPSEANRSINCKIIAPNGTQSTMTFITDAQGCTAVSWTPIVVGRHYLQIESNDLIYHSHFWALQATESDDYSKPSLPSSFSISQNHPNPFNASTMIYYSLPEPHPVSIVIYTTLGKKIRTLVSQMHRAGQYNIIWDGKDDQGISVSSGIYIYKIKVGEFIRTKKMVLLL